MMALLKQNLLHILRTRLLFVLFTFSFLVQYVSLKMVHFMTFKFQGIVTIIGAKDAIFAALFFQLFAGAFIAAAYGIWMVPYAHQGPRSPLTFTLPVAKAKFPLAYALSMLGLLLVQHLIMLLSFAVNFGFAAFQGPEFPWLGLLLCLLLETLAFEVFMFGFALSSMTVGQVPTFFLGALTVFLLQIGGALFRIDLENLPLGSIPSSVQWVRLVYSKLPPVGELVFDLRQTFLKPSWESSHFVLWLVWLGLLGMLFRLKLCYPLRARVGEN